MPAASPPPPPARQQSRPCRAAPRARARSSPGPPPPAGRRTGGRARRRSRQRTRAPLQGIVQHDPLEPHLRPVPPRRLDLREGGLLRHEHRGAHPSLAGGPGDRLPWFPALAATTPTFLLLREACDAVQRTSNLERPGALEVLRLEPHGRQQRVRVSEGTRASPGPPRRAPDALRERRRGGAASPCGAATARPAGRLACAARALGRDPEDPLEDLSDGRERIEPRRSTASSSLCSSGSPAQPARGAPAPCRWRRRTPRRRASRACARPAGRAPPGRRGATGSPPRARRRRPP